MVFGADDVFGAEDCESTPFLFSLAERFRVSGLAGGWCAPFCFGWDCSFCSSDVSRVGFLGEGSASEREQSELLDEAFSTCSREVNCSISVNFHENLHPSHLR